MHLTVIALGSRGDVEPYAALGAGLQAAGHRVRFATFRSFAPLIASYHLDLHPIEGDAQALVGAAGANMLKLVFSFSRLARGYAHDLTPLASLPTDCIICQLPGALYGYDLAEALGVPLIIAAVIPLTATDTMPVMGFPTLSFKGYNRLSYRLAEQIVWTMFRPVINHWRVKTLGLKPSPFTGYFRNLDQKRVPVLNGFSPHLVPRPPDWGDHVHITGYWYPKNDSWEPPPDLVHFLQSGPPPVFIGFGSMPIKYPHIGLQVIKQAVELSDQRAILHVGWGGLDATALPATVFRIHYAPYDWLFPQMAALIHHGGSGTTHFAARSGVPSLVTPFVFDQPYWGNRLAAQGVGPAPIRFLSLSINVLRDAIIQLTTDETMRQAAAVLGEKIKLERGIEEAVAVVEGLY